MSAIAIAYISIWPLCTYGSCWPNWNADLHSHGRVPWHCSYPATCYAPDVFIFCLLLQSSRLWEKEWGEHMHHGFYDPKSSIKKTNLQAQIDMIEKTIDFAGITDIESAVDVGCGIGGSSRYCFAPPKKCYKPHCPVFHSSEAASSWFCVQVSCKQVWLQHRRHHAQSSASTASRRDMWTSRAL